MSPKNNLKEHLRWLTTARPAVPSYITPLSSSLEPKALPSNTATGNSFDVVHVGTDGNGLAWGDEVKRDSTISRPERRSDGPEVQEVEEGSLAGGMARLIAAPGSTRKPTLIQKDRSLSGRSDAVGVGLPVARTLSGTVLKKEGLATPESLASGKGQDVGDTSRKAVDGLDRQLRFSSSSLESFEEFGEPISLWTEKHALQTAPSPRRGKKRKSSEMVGHAAAKTPAQAPARLQQDDQDFTPIEDLDELGYVSDAVIASTPTRAKKRRSPQTFSQRGSVAEGDRDAIHSSIAHEKLGVTRSPDRGVSKNSKKKSVSSAPALDWEHSVARASKVKRAGRAQVMDSDDDDDEGLSPTKDSNLNSDSYTTAAPQTLPAIQKDAVKAPLVKQSDYRKADLIRAGSPPDAARDDVQSSSTETATKPSRTLVGASPFHSDSPSKISSSASSGRPQQTIPGTPAPRKDPSVQALLKLPRKHISEIIDQLDAKLNERLETIWEGAEAGDFDEAANQEAEALRDRTDDLSELLGLLDEHKAISAKAASLQAKFKQAFRERKAANIADFRLPQEDSLKMVAIEEELLRLISVCQDSVRIYLQSDLLAQDGGATDGGAVLDTPQIKRSLSVTQIPRSPASRPRDTVLQTQSFGEVLSTPRRERRPAPQFHDLVAKQEYSSGSESARRSPLRIVHPNERIQNAKPQAAIRSKHTSPSRFSARYDDDVENHMDFDPPPGSPQRPIEIFDSVRDEYSRPALSHRGDDSTVGGDVGHVDSLGDNEDDDEDDDDMLDCLAQFEAGRRRSPPRNQGLPSIDATLSAAKTPLRNQTKAASNPFKVSEASKSLMSFPWSKDVKAALVHRFGLQGFRHNQLEAINATLAGKDTFVLMPTGGGKSLCYQLPAVVTSGKTRGVTIVVSPLLSLMTDQVQHLSAINVQATLINSETTPQAKSLVMDALRGPDPGRFVQLLYVTPEMLSKNKTMINLFKTLNSRGQIARIVVDEAHCVSQWGHDFRPDYQCIGEFRRELPGVPLMALTATATENVKMDVMQNLAMTDRAVFTQSFNRPNLYYEVNKKETGTLDKIAKLIKERHSRQCGIIYCLSRKNCENTAEKLRENHKIKAQHYHAGMESDAKVATQSAWQRGEVHVIVATIAFGMGIDKSNVRYVIHQSVPKSLEGYYQETGRAGRDGKPSSCYLFYSFRDITTLDKMIREDANSTLEQKERQFAMLREVNRFCETRADCRRVQILRYFGERFTPEECASTCDNCNSSSTFERQDFTELARLIIELVKAIGGNKRDFFSRNNDIKGFTKHQCVDLLRGSGGKSGRRQDAMDLDAPHLGSAKDQQKDTVERLFNLLITEDALQEIHVVNKAKFPQAYLILGDRWQQYLQGRKKVQMEVSVSPLPMKRKAKSVKSRTKSASDDEAEDVDGRGRTSKDPTSTMLSSPLARARDDQKKLRLKLQKPKSTRVEVDDDGDDDSDYGFEPVRDIRQPKSKRKAPELGPPITENPSLEGLDSAQRIVLEQSFDAFRSLARDIMNQKGLRKHPFTDTQLRQMIIQLPRTEDEMVRNIAGVRPEMVSSVGHRFLELIANARDFTETVRVADAEPTETIGEVARSDEESEYEESDGSDSEDGKVYDKNHEVEHIVISDDEEAVLAALEYDLDETTTGQTSQYFRPAADVADFNARMSQAAPALARSSAQSKYGRARKGSRSATSSRKPGGRSRFGSSNGRARSVSSRASKASARSQGSRAPSRATSKKSTKTGREGSNLANYMSTSGIGMMPT